MIKAEELNEFLSRKKNICVSHIGCKDCPLLSDRESGYCAANYGEVTQGQIDAVMTWELPVDWSKVPVDTKVIVWDGEKKYKRYFAKYENGKIYTFENGMTSWSEEHGWLAQWKYGRIAEDER